MSGAGTLASCSGRFCGGILALVLTASPAICEREVAYITIYEGGFALVQEVRQFELKEGMNSISLDDLPNRIDPATVAVSCLSAPDKVTVDEKSFSPGLESPYQLLEERFFGSGVRVGMENGNVHEGVLADYTDNHVVLMTDEGMLLINRENMSEMSLPETDRKLAVRPTLSLSLSCEVDGTQRLELDYLVDGIGWRAEYSLLEREGVLNLKGWVAIDNHSGADYPDVAFRLVSGGVRRAVEEKVIVGAGAQLRDESAAYARGVEARAFSDYHVYTVERKASFRDGELKQIDLFDAPDVKAEKEYTYEGGNNARVNYKFVNSVENGLGIPLPAGRLRVYRADAKGSVLFLGEDKMKQSARGEEVRVYIGDAFDIVAERKQVETKQITRRSREETYEIELRNHKDEKIALTVVEKLARNREWKVVNSSHEWKKKDAWTIEFPLSIEANGEATVKYTVLYRW